MLQLIFFHRLTLRTLPSTININNCVRQFHISPCLLGEPLKKRKKLDPAILRAREERKKKKLERQIRKLERNARQLKPIEECEIPLSVLNSQTVRSRPHVQHSAEVIEQRIALHKAWGRYKHKQHLADIQLLDKIAYAQQKALDELRKESEELYQEAIQDPEIKLQKTKVFVEVDAFEELKGLKFYNPDYENL
ncbi:hypothetical protein FQA39_LY18161 [Lamprigera yunnana]|nr:hypothetical protein FQA39_LY18161 [Lamprigera yunnana]